MVWVCLLRCFALSSFCVACHVLFSLLGMFVCLVVCWIVYLFDLQYWHVLMFGLDAALETLDMALQSSPRSFEVSTLGIAPISISVPILQSIVTWDYIWWHACRIAHIFFQSQWSVLDLIVLLLPGCSSPSRYHGPLPEALSAGVMPPCAGKMWHLPGQVDSRHESWCINR